VIRLLSDENFNNDLVRGLLRRSPQTDLVRVQDIGLCRAASEVRSAAMDRRGRLS
jgi:hypothetical protein